MVKTDSDNPEQYTELKSIFIELGNALVPFIINSVQLHKSGVNQDSIRKRNKRNSKQIN